MLFITHDLALVSSIASRTIVLQRGSIVEHGPTPRVLDHPGHPYTQMLLSHHDSTQTRDPDERRSGLDARVSSEPRGAASSAVVAGSRRPRFGCS